jgi:hypothetical protein
LYGPSYVSSFKSGVKKFNNSIEERYDDFSPVSEAVKALCGFDEKGWRIEEQCLRQKLAYDCRSAKRFHVRQRQLVALRMPR